MAFQVRDTCYSTAQQAAEVTASGVVGSVVVIGSKAYTVSTTSISGSVINYRFAEVGGGGIFTQAAAYVPQPCALLETADGLVIGWGIAAAWLATAAVLFLRRGLHE